MPLFARTARSVSLCEAGSAFVAAVDPALGDIQAAAENIRTANGEVSGLLRLNVPRVALQIALTPVLAEMV